MDLILSQLRVQASRYRRSTGCCRSNTKVAVHHKTMTSEEGVEKAKADYKLIPVPTDRSPGRTLRESELEHAEKTIESWGTYLCGSLLNFVTNGTLLLWLVGEFCRQRNSVAAVPNTRSIGFEKSIAVVSSTKTLMIRWFTWTGLSYYQKQIS